jgi:glyoxylate reductase
VVTNKRQVYSVGLDVYEDEPKISEELIKNPNVFLLPHIGTATYETQKEMEELVLENLRLAVTEDRLISLIPEQQQKK